MMRVNASQRCLGRNAKFCATTSSITRRDNKHGQSVLASSNVQSFRLYTNSAAMIMNSRLLVKSTMTVKNPRVVILPKRGSLACLTTRHVRGLLPQDHTIKSEKHVSNRRSHNRKVSTTNKVPVSNPGAVQLQRYKWDQGPIPRYFYLRNDSTIMQPQYSSFNAYCGLGTLTALNFAIFFMWNAVAVVDDDNGNERESKDYVGMMQPQNADSRGNFTDRTHEDWMLNNFTVNLTNTREGRLWTVGTASISHQGTMHLIGNMFAMWLFGYSTYRVIGAVAFFGLYGAGGFACSVAHLIHNLYTGRTNPPLSMEERDAFDHLFKLENKQKQFQSQHHSTNLSLDEARQLQAAKERLRYADMPSLGASGSVMAISAVAATLFPRDRIRPHPRALFPLPVPVAVCIYALSDLFGVVNDSGDDNVDHAGHFGGLLMGIVYVTTAWYTRRGSFRLLHSYPTDGHLPIVHLLRKQLQSIVTKTNKTRKWR